MEQNKKGVKHETSDKSCMQLISFKDTQMTERKINGVWGKAPTHWAIVLNFAMKSVILIPLG